ncbi:MAG: mechanosensitive ion channel family protein [Gammaproteobacteria bacterium]|nr:MAG: mechanosensitive ion channel family protein [Gammaproteobacteria bacterium]
MNELIERMQSWAEFIGPNIYLQAAALALTFILFGKIADIVLSKTIAQFVARSETEFDDELVVLLHRPIFVTFVLIGLALATRRLGMPATPEYITLGILRTIAIFIWFTFLSGFFGLILSAVRRGRTSSALHASMLPLLGTFLKVVLIALAVYFIFLAWSIDVTAWVASAGIVGLALSFAAKDTLSNLFAGVAIAADAPYKTGDFIILESGERGMVTHIGLRSTRMLTRDDVEITVPNSLIGNGKIINEAGGPSARHRIRIAVGVAYGSDIDQVIDTLATIADEHDDVCKSPEPRVRFRSFGEYSLDFELLCWIDQPIDRGRILHELNCTVYKAFQRAGIEIPFPQRDLHVRTMPAQGN